MKVKDLMAQLAKEDPERVVVCQRDPEGNGFAPLLRFSHGAFRARDQAVGIDVLTDADRKAGYTEEDVLRGGRKALFLVPSS